MTLQIISAKYFTRHHSLDVAEQIKQKIVDGNLDILVNNTIAGDPHYGTQKRLLVKYLVKGKECEKQAMEGDRLRILTDVETQIIEKEEKRVQERIEARKLAPITNSIKRYAATPAKRPPVDKPNMTDIIIPSYNNEKVTIECFESIKQNTDPGTYRIIWVDNGSKDYRKAAKVLKDVNHISIMLKTNKGFVEAINAGLEKSDAPTVCFLNNDTQVPPRWLDKLTDALYSDSKLGIVGPLTGPPAVKQQFDSHHNIAYQQRARQQPVFPYYRNLEDFNLRLEAELPGVTGQVDFVAFLCAVIKREVVDAVGPLDTNYTLGMWDDLDWSRSAEEAGYSHALLLDTCIIHKGRATFKILEKTEGVNVPKLVQKNKAYLDMKWGLK